MSDALIRITIPRSSGVAKKNLGLHEPRVKLIDLGPPDHDSSNPLPLIFKFYPPMMHRMFAASRLCTCLDKHRQHATCTWNLRKDCPRSAAEISAGRSSTVYLIRSANVTSSGSSSSCLNLIERVLPLSLLLSIPYRSSLLIVRV